MDTQSLALTGTTPGTSQQLTVHRFGPPGGAAALIQAGLHADEAPPLLVAQALKRRLLALEADGALRGEVRLVPFANPLGLAQQHLGQHQGRFDFSDGVNFNRGFADLGDAAIALLEGKLGPDPAGNTDLARAALAAAAAALTVTTPAEDLKRRLLQLAADCRVVLDLHCDTEAVLHLYALTPHAPRAATLGALLGAQAILLAEASGDSPFDEACSRPWLRLQRHFAPLPIPLDCFSTPVELRGQFDTDHALAEADADALIEFLRHEGLVAGAPRPLPQALCEPTPLAASEPVRTPRAGVVVFRAAPGDWVQAGQPIADVVDIRTGEVTAIAALSSGRLYARDLWRWAPAGARLAKVAGTTLERKGKLLGA